jgi:beta-N-acetylhexosaminidase
MDTFFQELPTMISGAAFGSRPTDDAGGCQEVEQEFDGIWRAMSAEQRAGMLIWPSLAGPELLPQEREILERFAPWGVSFFGRNLRSLVQGAQLIKDVRRVLSSVRPPGCPLGFFAADEEGGRVSRLPLPFPRTPSALDLAKEGEEVLRSYALMRAGVSKALGLNMIYAPVCDVVDEFGGDIIGDRSFGSDPEAVVRAAACVMNEMISLGVCPVLKHFPGHGATGIDTHKGSARVKVSLESLQRKDLAVFRDLIHNQNPPAIMTCHVIYDALDRNAPATLSEAVISQLLRRDLGFGGLVISDDLRMNAIAEHYGVVRAQDTAASSDQLSRLDAAHRALTANEQSSEDYLIRAAMQALLAGCDAVLCCRSVVREAPVLEAVAQALRAEDDKGSRPFAETCRLRARQVFIAARRFGY